MSEPNEAMLIGLPAMDLLRLQVGALRMLEGLAGKLLAGLMILFATLFCSGTVSVRGHVV